MSGVATAIAVSAGVGYLGSKSAAKSNLQAAQTSSDAQLQSAALAAEAQKFRPVGLTTRFGTSTFGFNDDGYLDTAGYTLSPELKASQDYILSQVPGAQRDAGGLLSLGRSYLSTTPEAAAADYIAKQKALLAPSEQSQLFGIREKLQRTGRGGLAVGQGGPLAAANPELQAYYNSLAMRDLQLGANADVEARNRITFGQGLLSDAYAPITGTYGAAQQLEALGQTPLALGAELGGRTAQYGANVGQSLLQGGTNAARTLQQAQAINPFASTLQGFHTQISQNPQALGSWLSSLNAKPVSTFGVQSTPSSGYNMGSGDYLNAPTTTFGLS